MPAKRKPAPKPKKKVAPKPKAKPKAKAKPAAKPRAKPAAKPKAKPAAKPKAKSPLSAEVAAAFGVKLPERYRRFLDSGELAKHNHKFATAITGMSGRREVVFDAPKLRTVFRTHGVKVDTIIPIAALAGNPELITLDVSDPKCPIGVWDEGAFVRWLPSLDALLAALVGKHETTPKERLDQAVEAVRGLHDAGEHAKIIAILTPAIGDQNARNAGPAPIRLAQALQLRARAYGELDRDDEWVADLEAAAACGTKYGNRATLQLIDLALDRNDAAGAMARCEALAVANSPRDFHVAFWGALYHAVARVMSGDTAGGEQELKAVAAKYCDDAEERTKARDELEQRVPGSPLRALFPD